MDGKLKQDAGEVAAKPARRKTASGVPPTINAIDIAMDAGRHDPDPDSPTRRVLLKNERLIDAQTAQLGRQRWRDFIVTALGVCVLTGAGLLV